MKHCWGRGIVALGLLAGCGSSSSSSPANADAPDAAPPPSRATGDLASWQTLTPMPVARANHCAVAANGYLVVIGGNYKPAGKPDFVNLADVHVARIAADGTVGEWKLAGKTPSPVNSCTAAADGKNVYLVDGIFDSDAAGGVVRRAPLSDDGVLGEWQSLGALPKDVRILYSNAVVTNGTLNAFYAKLPDAGDGIVLASVSVTGAELGAWQQKTWLKGFRGHPQYALATVGSSSFVYALGGYSGGNAGNSVLADGAGAALDAQGVPGASFVARTLPKPTSNGQAVAVDDWIFVVGGKDDVLAGKGRPDVYAANIVEGGSLDAWRTVAALPEGRTSLAVALYGDFIYATGGGFDAGGLDSVYSARVRFPAPTR
jgi:hypothetical protein